MKRKMKKLIVFLMCLALAANYAFAGDAISFRLSGDATTVGDTKYVDDPDLPEADSPRCPACWTLQPCGEPTETEPNDYCSSPDQLTLGCGSIVYGKVCDDNSDYFLVTIPGMTEFVITLFDGANCDRNPTVNARMKPYYAGICTPIVDVYTHENITATNENENEISFIVRVKRDNNENEKYALFVACSPVIIPCPDGVIDYCANPIVVPAGLPLVNDKYYYHNVANSCCATDFLSCIHEDACNDFSCYTSGNDIVYELNLHQETTLRIETGVDGGGDTQFMVATDCSLPRETCIATSDKAGDSSTEWLEPEVIDGLVLQAGVYYIITSMFGQNQCGELYITIEGDHELPVELTGFDAIAGDASITLNWTTASESGTDHFDIVRDGATVGRVSAHNAATGSSYNWTEENLTNGMTYNYSLVSVDFDGSMNTIAEASATPSFDAAAVTEYALHQNYPNPFNPETNISFDIAEAGLVKLTVFNPLGQTVATLVNGQTSAGRHNIFFDGSNLTSGLYYYRLEVGDFSAVRKMVLMK